MQGVFMMRKAMIAVWILVLMCLVSGCAASGDAENEPFSANRSEGSPDMPAKLKANEEGVPILKVYQVDESAVEETDVESYLLGVVAGEMKNDWPLEALKAQAILARTFVMKFCTEKESAYAGADISTDIEEAQAYDATAINETVEKAVSETRGQVLSHYGELPYSWFHAHSGGMTAGAREGLAFEGDEPSYIKIVEGQESEKAPDSAKEWTATFTAEEVVAAAKTCGASDLSKLESIEVGERGDSGRATVIKINGQTVSAPEFRLALGATKMRSTLLTKLELKNDQVIIAGKGYGHGVGMPQWGAYALAEEGKTAEEIVTYYFNDVTVEKMW